MLINENALKKKTKKYLKQKVLIVSPIQYMNFLYHLYYVHWPYLIAKEFCLKQRIQLQINVQRIITGISDKTSLGLS